MTREQPEQAALKGHQAGDTWGDFWRTVAGDVAAAEPWDRQRYRQLVARLTAWSRSGTLTERYHRKTDTGGRWIGSLTTCPPQQRRPANLRTELQPPITGRTDSRLGWPGKKGTSRVNPAGSCHTAQPRNLIFINATLAPMNANHFDDTTPGDTMGSDASPASSSRRPNSRPPSASALRPQHPPPVDDATRYCLATPHGAPPVPARMCGSTRRSKARTAKSSPATPSAAVAGNAS